MGDAADDAYNAAIKAEETADKFRAYLLTLKEQCVGQCSFVWDDQSDEELPILCTTCKERMDWPT